MSKMYFFNEYVKNVLDENCIQRESAIEIALSHVKEEFGDPNKDVKDFLKNLMEKGGADALEDYIIKEVEPRIDKIVAQEKLTTGGRDYDYDELLRGLIAYLILTLELKKDEKTDKKNTDNKEKSR